MEQKQINKPGWPLIAGTGLMAIFLVACLVGLTTGRFPWQSPQDPAINPTPTVAADSGLATRPSSNTIAITPTNEPTRLLALADNMLLYEQLPEAAAQYRLILANWKGSSQEASAQFGLAQAEYGRGRYNEAISAYQDFIKNFPKDSRKRQAQFRVAESQANLGQWENAIAGYRQYQQDYPDQAKIIEGYLNYSLASAQLANNNTAAATESLNKVLNAPNASSAQVQALAGEKLGDNYAAQNRPVEAANAYNKVLAVSRVNSYRAGIALKIAAAYGKAGQTEQARQFYRAVVDGYFGTPAANTALQYLIDNNVPGVDDYLRAYNSYRQEDYNNTIILADKTLGRPAPDQPVPAFPADLPAAQQERLARVWLWEANSVADLGINERAVNEYRNIMSRFPTTPAAEEANWQLAGLLRRLNRLDEAIGEYGALASRYPSGQFAQDALFTRFQLVFQKDGVDKAAPLADALFGSNGRGSEALFQVAHTYEAQGRQEVANPLYRKIAALKTDDYYTVRSSQILANTKPLPATTSTTANYPAVYSPAITADISQADQQTMEQWLTGWVLKTNPKVGSLEDARKTVLQDPGAQRLFELTLLGRNSEARREAMELNRTFQERPYELYALSVFLRQQRQYYYSILSAKDLFALYHKANPSFGLLAAPAMLQKLIYPLYFLDPVLEQSHRNSVDPVLVLAMMKQESAFDSNALSGAEAGGLTQVIPSTAQGIAKALGKQNYQTDDIYHPYTAIEFGTYYLASQMVSFGNNPYIALAGYNGGGGNAAKWAKANPPDKDFDRYVEGIEYSETRQYVKIIYTNYYVYLQLYQR